MSVAIWCRAAVTWGVLGIAMLFAFSNAAAQQSAKYLHASPSVGATVSVATLRIPEKAWKHFAKAKLASEHNHLEESDRETEMALAIAPDFAAAYLLRADIEVREHLFDAAIANAKEAERVEPDAMWVGVILAGAYNGLHRFADARLVLRGLRGAEAETWQAAYEGARASTGLKDVEGALRWSALALNAAPEECMDVHLVRTNALMLANLWSDAQAQIEIYLQFKSPQAHRPEVLAALELVKRRVHDEELQKVASR